MTWTGGFVRHEVATGELSKMSEPIVKRRPMIDLEEFERRLRKPLAANQGDDDPLAELARFVGEQEDPYREDPYKTVFEPLSRRPAGTSRSGPDHGEGEDLGAREPLIRGDFAAIEAGLLGAARHESGGNLSESEDLDGCEEAEGAEHWRYEDTAAGSREAGPPFEEIRSRRPLYVMAAMIVAGIVGIGATFAFKGAVSHQDEVATIRAADGSAKIQPETAAAGTEIPNQDASILGGSPQPPPVAVVNNVEQPADLSAQANVPEAQADPPRAIAGLATGAASVPVPAPPAREAAGAGSAAIVQRTAQHRRAYRAEKGQDRFGSAGRHAPAKRHTATGYGANRARARRAPRHRLSGQGRNAKIGGAGGDDTEAGRARRERQSAANLRCRQSQAGRARRHAGSGPGRGSAAGLAR